MAYLHGCLGLHHIGEDEEAFGEEGDEEDGGDAESSAEGGAANAVFAEGDDNRDGAEVRGERGAFFRGEFPLRIRGVGGGFGVFEEGVEGAGAASEELEFGGFLDEGFDLGGLKGGGLAEDIGGDAGFEMLVGDGVEVVVHGFRMDSPPRRKGRGGTQRKRVWIGKVV